MSIVAFATLEGPFTAEDELIVVCCGCQRLRVGPLDFVEADERIDAKRDSVSHTLCPDCADRHYGFSRARYTEIVCKSLSRAS